MSTPDLLHAPQLDADAMKGALGRSVIGREIIVLEEVSSTNDVVAELAKPSTAEGLVLFAESQTAGRGKHGKRCAAAQFSNERRWPSFCCGIWIEATPTCSAEILAGRAISPAHGHSRSARVPARCLPGYLPLLPRRRNRRPH